MQTTSASVYGIGDGEAGQRRRGEKQSVTRAARLSFRSRATLRSLTESSGTRTPVKQAVGALGRSLAKLDRRVAPTIEVGLNRVGLTADPGRRARALPRGAEAAGTSGARRPARHGRKPGLPPEIVARVRGEYANGASLGGDRADAQRWRCADLARRPPVAVDGARRSRSARVAQLGLSGQAFRLKVARSAVRARRVRERARREGQSRSPWRPAPRAPAPDVPATLGPILTRLDPRDAEWVVPIRSASWSCKTELSPAHDHQSGGAVVRRQPPASRTRGSPTARTASGTSCRGTESRSSSALGTEPYDTHVLRAPRSGCVPIDISPCSWDASAAGRTGGRRRSSATGRANAANIDRSGDIPCGRAFAMALLHHG